MRANAYLAAPIAAAQLVQMAINIADQVMVGRLGSTHLAAITLGSYIWIIPQLFGLGLLSSVSALGAQAYGADNHDRLARIVRGGLILSLLLAIPNIVFSLIAVIFLADFGLFLGHYLGGNPQGYDAEMLSLIRQYLFIGFIAMPAFLFYTAIRNFITILGKNISIPIIAAIALALGILTNYIFIYGNWGMPALGIVGAGLSLIVLNWFQLLVLAFYISRHPFMAKYRIFSQWRSVDFSLLKELWQVGFPSAMTIIFEAGLFTSSSFLMAIFGQASAAGYGATLSICSTTFMVPWAIGQAATVCVGKSIGAGELYRTRKAGYAAMILGVGFMAISALVMALFPRSLMSIFLDSQEPGNAAAIAAGLTFLPIGALFQIVDGLQVTAIGALRGIKDTRLPMLITGIGYWILGMGSALLLGFGLKWGDQGIFWGLAIGLAFAAFMLTWRFLKIRIALHPVS